MTNMQIEEEPNDSDSSSGTVQSPQRIAKTSDTAAPTSDADKRFEQAAPRFAPTPYFFGSPTAGQIMDHHRGTGPGFDTLRIGLSLTILVYHAKQIAVGRHADNYPAALFPVLLALVPIFFCLSGFLVTGSALRTRSIRLFLTNRSLRIFPALTVEVALSALILGPIVTSLPLVDYFSSKQFFSYFGNIIGRVRMLLPGVFLDNPIPATVNQSLWTLQPEFYCYLLMTALMASTLVYHRTGATVTFLVLTAALSIVSWRTGFGDPTDVFPGHVIVYYFTTGIIAFHWREYIPINFPLFLTAAGLSYVTITMPGMMYLASIPVAYCTIYLGMLDIPLVPPFNKGDYSYGVYLFNFPIQQALVHFFPGIHSWWLLVFISIPTSLLFAAASWRWIEKPALKLKRRFSGLGPSHEKA